jgi:hypothetical protein
MSSHIFFLFFLFCIGIPLPVVNVVFVIFYPPRCILIVTFVIVYVATNMLFYFLSMIFVCCFKDFLYLQLQNKKIKVVVYLISVFNILLSIWGALNLMWLCSQTAVGGQLVFVIATDIVVLFIINIVQVFSVCSFVIVE